MSRTSDWAYRSLWRRYAGLRGELADLVDILRERREYTPLRKRRPLSETDIARILEGLLSRT